MPLVSKFLFCNDILLHSVLLYQTSLEQARLPLCRLSHTVHASTLCFWGFAPVGLGYVPTTLCQEHTAHIVLATETSSSCVGLYVKAFS